MRKINIRRVFLGGVLAGVVFIITELVVEGIVHLIFKINEGELFRQTFTHVILSGARYHIVNFLYLFSFCTFTLLIYAVIRPKFGAGPKTAIIAAMIVLITVFLFVINHINMGIFPLKLCLMSTVLNIIEFPISIVAGASIYKEE